MPVEYDFHACGKNNAEQNIDDAVAHQDGGEQTVGVTHQLRHETIQKVLALAHAEKAHCMQGVEGDLAGGKEGGATEQDQSG